MMLPSFPAPRPGQGGESTLTAQLAEILARPVPDAARARAALHVLDWIGCAALGLRSPAGERLARFARAQGAGPCLGLGVGRLGPAGAILLNGGVGNVLEMDDTHRVAMLHPGPVVVPAALAAAEQLGSTGPALLDAVVRGYEAMIRIGIALGPAHYRLFHNTATCAPFGAAAAIGSLLGLGHGAMMDALGNAGTQAGGLWQCRHTETMTKQLHTGRGAQSGWISAMLAADGFTGPPAILEGPQGFFAALCADAAPELVAAEPDGPWRIAEVSLKPYPACRHVHAAIDAALLLRHAQPDAVRHADALLVTTYASALDFCDNPAPATPAEARFSLQHAAAVTLLDGAPWLPAFEPGAIDRPDVAAWRGRTTVAVDPAWGHAHPPRFRAALTLFRDNAILARAEVMDAKGDPANPMSDAEIAAKAMALLREAGLAEASADRVQDACLALPTGGPVCMVTDALAALRLGPTRARHTA